MFESKIRTELESIGEFGLIDRIKKKFPTKNESTYMGIGDDAAVISVGKEKILLSTDLLLEGIHFDLAYTPLKHLGYKAVTVNLSDIYAMNGTPSQITLSLGLSNRFSVEAVDELMEGAYLACANYGIDLVGGDTSASNKGLVISITCIGQANQEKICYRNGAKPSHLICVSGDLGGAYLGLQILEREKLIFLENPSVQPDFENKDYLIERQLRPEARRDIVELLAKFSILPSSMIDISDGLSSEILHLCHASKVGCKLFEDKIPLDPLTISTATELGLDPTVCALSGGEDYELLFTVPIEHYEELIKSNEISVIGHIVSADEGCVLISSTGHQYEIKAQGWKNFNPLI